MGAVNYPRYSNINAITNAIQAVVTFTADHDFTVGEIVSFRVSKDFGMYEINNKRSRVASITSDTITTELDSSTWTPFSYANIDGAKTTPPVCVPSSSGISANSTIPSTNIQDAFDRRRT